VENNSDDLYKRLAKHLDNLPGGFPETDSGVELRILKRLFTPEDAELALSLSLIAEEPRVIAHRANISVEEAATRLDEMEKKGLIYGTHYKDRPPKYTALQFIVGIWEFQVNKLTPELVDDVNEYIPYQDIFYSEQHGDILHLQFLYTDCSEVLSYQ
jgi:electron transport complex protein RnfB